MVAKQIVWSIALIVVPVVQVRAEVPAGKALPTAQSAAVDNAVESEIQKQKLVGVAVGVIQNGDIVYLRGYGHADREKKSAATERTVFNWASNSKPLAAVAAMQLVEARLLDLDKDVRAYVPEFPDKSAPITMRHLLAHQSGIPHYSNGTIVPTRRNYPAADPFMDPNLALDKFSQSPLIFKPGEKTSYSSYAFILVSAVIQRVGQKSFAGQINERIARPLSLKSLQLDVATAKQTDWSIGYMKNKAGEVVRAAEAAHYWKHGAGGYKSNIADFARWAQALIQGKLVKQETEKAMWTTQPLADGSKTTWGLGFTVDGQGGLRVSHGGKQDEATSRMVIYPRAKHGLVVLCNCGHGDVGAITTAIYKALNSK